MSRNHVGWPTCRYHIISYANSFVLTYSFQHILVLGICSEWFVNTVQGSFKLSSLEQSSFTLPQFQDNIQNNTVIENKPIALWRTGPRFSSYNAPKYGLYLMRFCCCFLLVKFSSCCRWFRHGKIVPIVLMPVDQLWRINSHWLDANLESSLAYCIGIYPAPMPCICVSLAVLNVCSTA